MEDNCLFEGGLLKFQSTSKRIPFGRSLEFAYAITETKTPFPLDKIYVFPAEPRENDNRSFFYVVRKDAIEPLFEQIAANSLRADRFGLRNGSDIEWLPSRSLETRHPAFYHFRHWRNFLLTATALLLTACCGTYAHSYLRYSQAEQALTEQMDVKRAEALQIRKLLDKQQKGIAAVEAARKGKSQAVPVVRVWEELTRVLSDDAWVTDIIMDGNMLTISGLAAQSAASLISTLDASALFSEPSFISPVVRVPGQAGERFEIRLKVQPS